MIAVFITLIGYVAMTVGSSPTVKGASFIWLPAALQLVAGVWLGPWLGLLAGGLGAYAAGILAYGGGGAARHLNKPPARGGAHPPLSARLFLGCTGGSDARAPPAAGWVPQLRQNRRPLAHC